jgi:preprotein translocase subunit SecE
MGVKEKVITYLKETRQELDKVTWPTKDEVRGSTIVTIVTSLLISAFIFGVDTLLSQLVKWLLS